MPPPALAAEESEPIQRPPSQITDKSRDPSQASEIDSVGENEDELADDDVLIVKRCLGMADEDDMCQMEMVHPQTSQIDLHSETCMSIADHPIFTSFFMFLTFYALFVPDLDQLFGNKASREFFLILNTVVCILFLLEVVVQSLGKQGYFLQAYFWLDTVALISLLPETWILQVLVDSNAGFVAGRSSRLARIIRVASRSSKATKMARLSKIASHITEPLLAKLGKRVGIHVSEQEVKVVLNKKLHRIFRLFDDDMDQLVSKLKLTRFLDAMAADIKREEAVKNAATKSFTFQFPSTSPKSADVGAENQAGTQNGEGTGTAQRMSHPPRESHASRTSKSRRIEQSVSAVGDDEVDDSEIVDFNEFSSILQQDPVVGPRLRAAVDAQLRKGINMKSMTSKQSEYIAVRVALGVIIVLFLLNVVEAVPNVSTYEMGLEHLVETMRVKHPASAPGTPVPESFNSQINMWKVGSGDEADRRKKVVWLDLGFSNTSHGLKQPLVYCDALRHGDSNCADSAIAYWSGYRPSLEDLDRLVKDSDYRKGDMQRISVPDLRDSDLSREEIWGRTTSLAILVDRGLKQKEAAMSILTTLLVVIVILLGVLLLTKDLALMSGLLLKPLQELADDMESLTQMQLAGAEDGQVRPPSNKGTDEIRRIKNTFEKMKMALKSWGKYVPWPVVQMLLRANVEAEMRVEPIEVSMYFSDIAGFTTIVESLKPEQSLMLLNRYFNDMTRIIDDHGGVVIEFIGDAILCIYGAPLVNDYHGSAAVKAALRMLAALKKLNAWSRTKNLPEVNIRCGVHTGEVLVGNMGFQTRIKYGVVGEDALIPERLESTNKAYGTTCLISHYTFVNLLPGHFVTRPVDFIQLKHAPGAPPEYIHQVMDRERDGNRTHPLWQVTDIYTEAIELYKRRDFKKALPKFKEAGRLVIANTEAEKDDASALMVQRCEAYMKKPPPSEWNGVWDGGDDGH